MCRTAAAGRLRLGPGKVPGNQETAHDESTRVEIMGDRRSGVGRGNRLFQRQLGYDPAADADRGVVLTQHALAERKGQRPQ